MRWTLTGLVVVTFLAACGSEGAETGDPSSTWEQLPDAPLSPRETAVAVAIGDDVLVVGGSDAAPCPPNAICASPEEPPLSDGAAFDVSTG